MWIGVERSHSDWIYSNGTSVTYYPWDFGEPNNYISPEDCVALQTAWHDRHCETKLVFACQYSFQSNIQDQVVVERKISTLELKPADNSAIKKSSLIGIMLGCAFIAGIISGGIVAGVVFWITVKKRLSFFNLKLY